MEGMLSNRICYIYYRIYGGGDGGGGGEGGGQQKNYL